MRARRSPMLRGLYGDIALPKGKRADGPEKAIQRACLDWLNSIPGVRMWRQNRGAKLNIYKRKDGTEGRSFVKFGERGATDTTGVGPFGVRIEIEIKAPGKTPDPDQLHYMAMVRDSGGISFWADSLKSCEQQMRYEFERRGWQWNARWEVA